MARRAKGEGSITKRPDGRWEVRLQVAGKRVTVYAKTQREAAEKLRALQKEGSTGRLAEPHTLGELFALWLDTGAARWKPGTLSDYRRHAQAILADLDEKTALSKLTVAAVQRLVNKHREQPRTAQYRHRVLHAALALAVRWEWLPWNPADNVILPTGRKQRVWWTAEQLQAFLAGTKESHWWPLWAMAVATGCRLGELLALRWTDVDLERRVARIERTGRHVDKEWVETEPKTMAGRRSVALSSLALAALKRQRLLQAEWHLKAGPAWPDDDRVFTNEDGGPINRGRVAENISRACARLGLPACSIHQLRHLHASLALQAGAPLPLVSKSLGHANPGITASIYSHAVADGRVVADAVEAALQSAQGLWEVAE